MISCFFLRRPSSPRSSRPRSYSSQSSPCSFSPGFTCKLVVVHDKRHQIQKCSKNAMKFRETLNHLQSLKSILTAPRLQSLQISSLMFILFITGPLDPRVGCPLPSRIFLLLSNFKLMRYLMDRVQRPGTLSSLFRSPLCSLFTDITSSLSSQPELRAASLAYLPSAFHHSSSCISSTYFMLFSRSFPNTSFRITRMDLSSAGSSDISSVSIAISQSPSSCSWENDE